MTRTTMWVAVALCLGALTVACGGTDTTVHYNDDDSSVTLEDQSSQEDVSGLEGDSKPTFDGAQPTGDRYKIIPLHSADVPVPCAIGKNVVIQALVMDQWNDEEAQQYAVGMSVVSITPDCTGSEACGTLMAFESMTNTSGIASVTFDGAEAQDTLYTLKLTGVDAQPAYVQVLVGAVTLGDMQIQLNPTNPEELAAAPSSISVYWGKGYRSCTNFSVVNPWTDYEGSSQLPGLASVKVFEDLAVDEVYWAYAIGYRTSDGSQQLTAWGCKDMVTLMPQEQGVTPVTIQLVDVEYIPAGTYDLTNHIDFSDAIPGQAGEIVDLLEMIFYEPGDALMEGIQWLVSQWVSPALVNIVFGAFGDALGDLITQLVFDNAPPELLVFFEAGQDLLQVVDNLEMYGELKLAKTTGSVIQGIETWYGIRLHWEWFCNENSPEDCGTWEFGLDDLNNSEFPLDLIAGQFTAQVSGLDDLYIGNHEIKINYGQLILFVINDLILPAVTSYDSLTELLYSIIDCHALAQGMSSGILDSIGLTEQGLENFCNQAVTTLISPIETVIGGLDLPSSIWLSGHCTMKDDDGNLYVDRLVDGTWTGYLVTIDPNSGNAENKPIVGDFEATRKTQY